MMNFSLKYLHLLKTRFAGLNLTRILDDEDFYQKQVLDSILPYEQSLEFRSTVDQFGKVVDVGFGGGFPLLPLAHHCPGVRFLGLEARGKKVEAVRVIAEELGIKNAIMEHLRVHDVEFDIPVVVTFKAVGTVSDFLAGVIATHPDVRVYFYKGPSFEEKELPEFQKSLHRLWRIVSNEKLNVPGTEERRLVGFAPKSVPRGTSNLVKVSQFF